MYVKIRRSTKKDIEAVKTIIHECFGYGVRDEKHLTNMEGRYLLAEINGMVVGMTGICPSDDHGGEEVDYTGVLPKYRRRGIMDRLIKELLKDRTEPLWYSAWRFAGHERSNPQTILENNGFKLIKQPWVRWDVPATCNESNYMQGCKGLCGEHCHCYEDLWLWKPE